MIIFKNTKTKLEIKRETIRNIETPLSRNCIQNQRDKTSHIKCRSTVSKQKKVWDVQIPKTKQQQNNP